MTTPRPRAHTANTAVIANASATLTDAPSTANGVRGSEATSSRLNIDSKTTLSPRPPHSQPRLTGGSTQFKPKEAVKDKAGLSPQNGGLLTDTHDRKPLRLHMNTDGGAGSIPIPNHEALPCETSPRTPFEQPLSAVDYITARGGIEVMRSTASPLAMWSTRIAGTIGTGPSALGSFTGWGFGEAVESFELDTDEEEDCQAGLLSGSPEKWASILTKVAPELSIAQSQMPSTSMYKRTQAGATVRRSVTSPAMAGGVPPKDTGVINDITRSPTAPSSRTREQSRRVPRTAIDAVYIKNEDELQDTMAKSPSMPELQDINQPVLTDRYANLSNGSLGGARKELASIMQHGVHRQHETRSKGDTYITRTPPRMASTSPVPTYHIDGTKEKSMPPLPASQPQDPPGLVPICHLAASNTVPDRSYTDPAYIPPLDLTSTSFSSFLQPLQDGNSLAKKQPLAATNFSASPEEELYLSQRGLPFALSSSTSVNGSQSFSNLSKSSKTYAQAANTRANPMLSVPTTGLNHSRNPSAPNLSTVQHQNITPMVSRSKTPDERTSQRPLARQPTNACANSAEKVVKASSTPTPPLSKLQNNANNTINNASNVSINNNGNSKKEGLSVGTALNTQQEMRSKANRSGKQADSRGRSPTRKHLKPAAIARKRVSRSLERLAPTNNTQFGKINNVRRGSEDSVRGVSSSVSKTKPVSTANYIDLEDPDGLHEPLKSPLSPQHRPAGEEMSDTHKRRLLRFGPVLQVITSRTVKDRMLFLFPDLLIIVKPILPEGQQLDACNLDCRFQCRAIIPLGDVSMALMREEAMSPPDLSKLLDPEVRKAVQQFTAHPYRAIHQLIKKNLLRRDAASVAGFLLRTRGLDRRKVGLLISRPENTPAFAAFMERLPARGIPLPDLLRLVAGHMLLPTASGSTLRLDANNTDNIGESNGTWELHRPAEAVNEDPEARTRCIVMIADRWRTANPDYRLGRRAAIALLHTVLMASQKIATVSTTDTATATTRLDDFCQLFKCTFANHREDDGHSLFIPDLLLRHTFEATWIRPIRLDDGTESLVPNVLTSTPAPLDKEEDTDPSGRLWISVGTFPLRVTVRVPSPEIVIQLPYPDPHLQLCVVAENGLRSSSDIVEFTADREARITLTGVSVGRCVIAFELMGPNASRYSPIPPRTLSVERSFMRWAFRIRCESTFFSLEDLPIAVFRQPQTSNQDGYDLKKQAGSKAILPTPANGLNGSKSLQPQSRTHQEANSGDEDDDLPLAATAPRLDLGHWRDVAVGQGRAVKLSFSVESRDRQSAWCTMIEERARAIREQRDRTLPANAPVGEADRPGRPTRDRSLATHLARLLLPVTDEQASRSMVFTGKELVKLVGRYDYALRN